MVTYMLLLKRKKGMTKEQFRHHYETSHVAMAKKYLGHLFHDYRRHYPEENVGLMADGKWGSIGDDGYDAITKVDFKDRADFAEFQRLCQLPDIQKALSEDEERFLDRANSRMSVCEEVKTWTGADIRKSA
jgi:hypothetical protein